MLIYAVSQQPLLPYMEMGIVSSYEVRTIDRVWFLPRGDYELTLARLAPTPGI